MFSRGIEMEQWRETELNKRNVLAMEVGISQLQSLIQLYFFR